MSDPKHVLWQGRERPSCFYVTSSKDWLLRWTWFPSHVWFMMLLLGWSYQTMMRRWLLWRRNSCNSSSLRDLVSNRDLRVRTFSLHGFSCLSLRSGSDAVDVIVDDELPSAAREGGRNRGSEGWKGWFHSYIHLCNHESPCSLSALLLFPSLTCIQYFSSSEREREREGVLLTSGSWSFLSPHGQLFSFPLSSRLRVIHDQEEIGRERERDVDDEVGRVKPVTWGTDRGLRSKRMSDTQRDASTVVVVFLGWQKSMTWTSLIGMCVIPVMDISSPCRSWRNGVLVYVFSSSCRTVQERNFNWDWRLSWRISSQIQWRRSLSLSLLFCVPFHSFLSFSSFHNIVCPKQREWKDEAKNGVQSAFSLWWREDSQELNVKRE